MSEEITSKILEVMNFRDGGEGKYGRTWWFNLKMENGDIGSIGGKSETAYKVGDSLTYTKEKAKNGDFINFKKVNKNAGGFSRGPAPTPNAHVALQCATQMFAERNRVEPVIVDLDKIADRILAVAKKNLDWLNTNS